MFWPLPRVSCPPRVRALGRACIPAFLRLEDFREDAVYISQLALQIEGLFDNVSWDPAGDIGIAGYQFAEIEPLLPCAHGMGLDHSISILAGNSMLNQIQKKLPAEDQSAGAFKVGFHARRINEHGIDQVGGLVQGVIDERGRVGQDDSFDRRVRNIAFMPERDVLKAGLRV